MNTAKEDNHAERQAKAQFESICELIKNAKNGNETAENAIQEDPLSVQVRSNWHTPGDKEGTYDAEFNILLATGGPAVRIIGELGQYGPDNARLEYQDWGTPWTEYRLTSDEQDTLLRYCRHFYFGG